MERITVPVGGTQPVVRRRNPTSGLLDRVQKNPAFPAQDQTRKMLPKFSLFGRILEPLPKTFPLYCIFASKVSHTLENSSTVGSTFHFIQVENDQSF